MSSFAFFLIHVQQALLPWARRQFVAELDAQAADAENPVADTAMKAVARFDTFAGATGGEFYESVKGIAAQLIAHAKRLRRHALHCRGLLSLVHRRIVILRAEGHSLRAIAIICGHAP